MNRMTGPCLSLVHTVPEVVMPDGQTFSREGVNEAEFITHIILFLYIEH